jgi:hypothetical protein
VESADRLEEEEEEEGEAPCSSALLLLLLPAAELCRVPKEFQFIQAAKPAALVS